MPEQPGDGLHRLHAWEPDPDYPDREVRRDANERIVLSLGPEGREGSQCWAWLVHPASRLPYKYGVNIGSDLDRDTARRQADAAVVAYGYTLANPASWSASARRDAPAVALRIVNLPITEAARITQEAGIIFRVGRENGRPRITHDDRRRDRVTVTVVDGIVTAADPS
jgi:hypothetical protein